MTITTLHKFPCRAIWVAYAACGWAFVFAALSCYWALGGMAGAETLSPAIVQLARAHDPLVYTVLWLSVFIKIISGVVILALIRPWGRLVPRWFLLLLAWGAGTVLFGHGGFFFITGVLVLSGTIHVSTSLSAMRWYTFLWGPWWLLGGILFLLVAWAAMRGTAAGNSRADFVFSVLGVVVAVALLVLSGGTIG